MQTLYVRRVFISFILPVNIWDIVGEDQVLKGGYKVLSDRMWVFVKSYSCHQTQAWAVDSNDLSWDGESKRIIAVGDGKEKSATYFIFF